MLKTAGFVWSDRQGFGRNRYVAFRRAFELASPADEAVLHLFADTRYRLIINGVTICHGPARFVLSHPQYDSVDIAQLLRKGENVIAILANSYNCNSFHADVSIGGMICSARITTGGEVIEIVSDPSWKCQVLDAYRSDTHALSFALNPAEDLDARKLPTGWDRPGFDDTAWQQAALIASPQNWGQLSPRSIPMLDEREIVPQRRLGTFVARADKSEKIASLAMEIGSGEQRPRATIMVATWIHSPRAQQVKLGAWWGEYWLNGVPLTPIKRNDIAFRQDFEAELNEGWNLLALRESWGQEAWDFQLAYPTEVGLTLSATRDLQNRHQFLTAGPWFLEAAQMAGKLPLDERTVTQLPRELGSWQAREVHQGPLSCVRDRAWRKFERLENPAEPFTCNGADYADVVGGDTLVLLYEFGTEVLGRLKLDFEAEAGTIVDITFTERLKPDGVSDVHNRFFQDLVERYIARDGAQIWQQMHPRGGKYVEVLVRGNLARFKLNSIVLTRASYPVQTIGAFECGDPMLNAIWELGRRTQAACMEDAYLDCPMRERGLYAGDMLVQYLVNLATFGDQRLLPRCIEVFLNRQDALSGLIPGGAQGLPAGRHPDYSAILVQAIWQYYWRTGDRQWLAKIAPQLKKMLAGLESLKVAGSDLLDGSDIHPYIDLEKMDRGGTNCALNCFYQKAFADAASIFHVLGDAKPSQYYCDAAERLAAAIRDEFWDSARGVFTDRRKGDVAQPQPSVAANALPILYDIATPQQAELATGYLLDAMAHNFHVPVPKENTECSVTSYFSYYAIGALLKRGKVRESLAFMRRYWGYMLDNGAWTCWEFFADSGDSRCHAWSASPTHYLSTLLLGVTFPKAGDINTIRIAPQAGDLQWAQGTYPHPAGPIHVRWQQVAGRIDLEVQAPPAVTVMRE